MWNGLNRVVWRKVQISLGLALSCLALTSCGGSGSSALQDNTAPLPLSGSVSTVAGAGNAADGPGITATFNRPHGIAVVGNQLFVADSLNNKIRAVSTSSGVVSTLAGREALGAIDAVGTQATFANPGGVTTDGSYLYIADTLNHLIRKVSISDGSVSTLAGKGTAGADDGVGATASFNEPSGISLGGGHLYVADTANHKIRKIEIATGLVSTLAGSGVAGATDAEAGLAQFRLPMGVAAGVGQLFVADAGNHKIRVVDMGTGQVTTLAGSGSAPVNAVIDNIGVFAHFSSPIGIVVAGPHLYVADTGYHVIRKIVIATAAVSTLAGSPGARGAVDGNPNASRFWSPLALATDGADLFVADGGNNRIRKITLTTGFVATLAGTGLTTSSLDGIGLVASFNQPSSMVHIGSRLFIADTQNNKIRQYDPASGSVITVAGNGSYDFADGDLLQASFKNPQGLSSDGTDLFVADTSGNRIRRINLATGLTSTLAGNGIAFSADGIGTAAGISSPTALTYFSGHLYVVEPFSIRRIDLRSNAVTTLAGNGASSGSSDGPANLASFNGPSGITTDGNHLFVADTYNSRIRRISMTTGEVTTLAGSGSQALTDGTGASASFFFPAGITCHGAYLYVADTGNNAIRKIAIATAVVATLAGNGGQNSQDGLGASAQFAGPQGISTDGTSLYVGDRISGKIRRVR